MSKNGNESSDEDIPVAADSSDDGYTDDDFEYRHYTNPIMYYVPKEMRSAVRKLAKDTARLYAQREPVKRVVRHELVALEQPETCMHGDCNELTSEKCKTCHVILCGLGSKNGCFLKFHNLN